MEGSRGLRASWIAAAVALAALGLAVPAAASRGVAELKRVAKAPAQIEAHWTKRRMGRAQPLDLAREGSSGEPAPAPRRAAGASTAAGSPLTYPQVTHGKVFFQIGTHNYVCSGTVVPSAGDDLIATAGHCIFDAGETDQFVRNVAFVPAAYSDGDAPKGVWAAEQLATTSQWQASGDFRFDLAFVRLAKREGIEIEEFIGARGIAFNQARDQSYAAFGYPADGPFDGRTLRICESPYAGDDPFAGSLQPKALGIACDMTGGASGGGWVTAGGHVASITSFGYDSRPGYLYGPYFGTVAKELYAQVDGEAAPPSDVIDPVVPAGPARDATPPQTSITHGPRNGAVIAGPTPTFGLAASEPAARFECSVDAGPWYSCAASHTLGPLADGEHLFAARAIDTAGNADPTPVARAFTVDSAVAEPRVIAGKQRLRGRRIVVKVRAGAAERVRGRVSGKIAVRGSGRSFRLRPVRRTSGAGRLATYRLRPSPRVARRINALGRRKPLRAVVKVWLGDAAANAVTARERVVLAR